MSIFDFYMDNDFKLFKCGTNKAPAVPKGTDWRDSVNHITIEEAEKHTMGGGLIGAWIPKDILVIDVDCHIGKENGIESLKKLKDDLSLDYSLIEETAVVKTASGGFHLYYYSDKERYPATLAPGIDIKTNTGYVIAAGSPNYQAINNNDPSEMPEVMSIYIDQKIEERKNTRQSYKPDKALPVDMLEKILAKIDATHFNSNGPWLEFCMSAISTCGSGDEVIDALEKWSHTDEKYRYDDRIRQRIESIDPEGKITSGTFIFYLKREDLSNYYIDKVVKMLRGKLDPKEYTSKEETLKGFRITVSKDIIDSGQLKLFYQICSNMSAAAVLAEALGGQVIYVSGEKTYYRFNGERWEGFYDIFNITGIILEEAISLYCSEVIKNSDPVVEEVYNKIIIKLGETKFKRDVIADFQTRPEIHRKSVNWDAPGNRETLTMKDGVLDFTGEKMIIRHGKQDEYRRSFMNYSVSQFIEPGDPVHFNRFIDSTFPDFDTQETATYALSLFISGVSSYRIFQVWHGGGRNGKSTLMEIMKHVLGERAITYDPKLLLAKKIETGVGLTPELATFQGALVACGSETEENKKISTGLVKLMTGGETVKANPKHRDPIEFEATWQLVLATNDLPFFSASDNAFVDRLLLLPFKVKFARTEAELAEYKKTAERAAMGADGEKLKRDIEVEGADIIAHLIKNYIKLRDELDGTIPMSGWCTEKKSLYIQDNDDIRPFIDNMCIVDETMEKEYFASSHEVTQAFRDFVGNQRISPNYVTSAILKSKRFIMKGVKRVPNELGVSKQARGLMNIMVKHETGTEVDE